MEPEYDVFISHAGEDKDAVAVPIYEGLCRRGIRAFLDREELRTGGNAPSAILNAVDKAAIGLFILSPEYGAKRWPMLELDRFLKNAKSSLEQGDGVNGPSEPVLIPFFYRASVADCKDRALFRKHPELLQRPDMIDRLANDEANIKQILDSLAEVSRRTGIENKEGANNEGTRRMKLKRNKLVGQVCEKVSRAIGELRKAKMSSVSRIRERKQQQDMFQATFYVPANVDEVVFDFSSALSSNVAETPEAEVLREVLNAGSSTVGDRVIVLKGDGGVGKSCILRGLGNEEEARRRFGGGVYFISLGMDASLDTLIEELLKVLRLTGGHELEQQLRREKNLDVILESIGRWLKGKQILVLVDDLWERRGLGAWIISSLVGVLEKKSGSVVVVTTRMSSVAVTGKVIMVKTREPLSREMRSMLLVYARFSEAEVVSWGINGTVEDLLRICGGLPVCVGVVGRAIAQLILHCGTDKGLAWEKYHDVVSVRRDEMVKTGIYNYLDLMTTLAASLEVLEESEKGSLESWCKWSYAELHRGLSVLPKPAVVPISVVCRLWGVGKEEGLIIVKRFADVGLARIEVAEKEGGYCMGLHDLIHDFAVACSEKAEDSCAWHGRLLDGYCMDLALECGSKKPQEWWKLIDEKYISQNVCRHLVLSGRVEELLLLLVRCEWAEKRHNSGGVNAWRRDFETCLNGIDDEKFFLEEKDAVRRDLCRVRDAVVESWSYIHGSSNEFGFQMWGRLREEEGWVVSKFLKSVEEHLPRPWLKPLKQDLAEMGESSLYGEFTLRGRVHGIMRIRESMYAVTAGNDIWLIDVEDKRVIGRCEGHERRILAIGIHGGGNTMVSCAEDGTLCHWDMESATEVRRLVVEESVECEEDPSNVMCACIVTEADITCVGLRDGRVEVWGINTGAVLETGILKFEYAVTSISVSCSGRYIAASCANVIQIWDRFTGKKVLHDGKFWVTCITFSADEKIIACGSWYGPIRLWEMKTGSEVGEVVGSDAGVTCVAFSTDGRRLVSGTWNACVTIWDIETREKVYQHCFSGFVEVICAQIAANGDLLLAGSAHSLLVLRLDQAFGTEEDLGEQRNQYRFAQSISCLRASPDGRFFVSTCTNGSLVIWDSTNFEPRGPALHHEGVSCIAISSDSQFIASGCCDGKVRIWNAATYTEMLEMINRPCAQVTSVAFSPDGQLIVCGSEDGAVRIWKAADGKQIGEVMWRADRPDTLWGRVVALGSWITKHVTRQENEHTYVADVSCVEVTPDGSKVIACWRDHLLCMWDVKSGRIVCQVDTTDFGADRIVFGEDQSVWIISYSSAPDVWRLDDERGLVELPDDYIGDRLDPVEGECYIGHQEEVVLTVGGRYLVWRADKRRLAKLPVQGNVESWLYDADRKVVVIGGVDGGVYFYKVML